MTKIIVNNIENINDLAMFTKSFKKGKLKFNVSKLAKKINKDRKTVRNYLSGKTPSTTRIRVKYLDE